MERDSVLDLGNICQDLSILSAKFSSQFLWFVLRQDGSSLNPTLREEVCNPRVDFQRYTWAPPSGGAAWVTSLHLLVCGQCRFGNLRLYAVIVVKQNLVLMFLSFQGLWVSHSADGPGFI